MFLLGIEIDCACFKVKSILFIWLFNLFTFIQFSANLVSYMYKFI